jgi:hypothetical protein
MQQTIRITKVGNSLYIKVPMAFREMYDLEPGDYFVWKYEEGASAHVQLLRPVEDSLEHEAGRRKLTESAGGGNAFQETEASTGTVS